MVAAFFCFSVSIFFLAKERRIALPDAPVDNRTGKKTLPTEQPARAVVFLFLLFRLLDEPGGFRGKSSAIAVG